MMAMSNIRDVYKVPAKRGGLVMWHGTEGPGTPGVITGSDGAYLRIRLIGQRRSRRYHPTYRLSYISNPQVNDSTKGE